MIWVKLLTSLILFGAIQASTRMCAQCVAGDFVSLFFEFKFNHTWKVEARPGRPGYEF